MEPRPQRPRPQTPPPGSQPNGGQQQGPPVGPDPSQQAPQHGPPEQDPAAFVSPPRMEYDYSPLDLQPPGQRRKRQIIAGIIGALVVVAIGALIVAGWMALREDDEGVGTDENNDRVAELTATETDDEADDEGAAPADDDAAGTPAAEEATQVPTEVPPTPTPEAIVYDENSIRAALPVVESMPGPFQEAGDTPQELEGVIEALGGGPEVEQLLETHGWQAGMARTYESTDPATTGSTTVVVSVHAFESDEAAQAMLPEFDSILSSFGWTQAEMEQIGDGSAMLTWTAPDTGNEAVTIYLVDGQLVYRVMVQGPPGVDSTENAIYVANQILGQ